MSDKKVATQASDGPWERETIITFNDAEKKHPTIPATKPAWRS